MPSPFPTPLIDRAAGWRLAVNLATSFLPSAGALLVAGFVMGGCTPSKTESHKSGSSGDSDHRVEVRSDRSKEKPVLISAQEVLSKAANALYAEPASQTNDGLAKRPPKNLMATGTIENPKKRFSATYQLHWHDGRFRMDMTAEGIGQVTTVYDGNTVWSDEPIRRQRVVDGLEAKQVIRGADFFLVGNWKNYFDEAHMLPSGEGHGEPENGERLLRVELVSNTGDVTILGIDPVTYLLRTQKYDLTTPDGVLQTLVHYSDYKQVAGFNIAFKQVIISRAASDSASPEEYIQRFSNVDSDTQPLVDEKLDLRSIVADGREIVPANPALQ